MRSAPPAGRGRAETPGSRSSARPRSSAARPRPGHGGTGRIEEPPGLAPPRLRGVADADSRRRDDLARGDADLEPERRCRVQQVERGVGAGDVEGRRDEPGSRGEAGLRKVSETGDRSFTRHVGPWIRRSATPRAGDSCLAHRARARDRLDRANQHGRRTTLGLRDDVQALVHPVDKVHVGPSGGPVHDGVAGGPPEARMGGSVVLADVRLHLDDAADAAGLAVGAWLSDEQRAKQRMRGAEGRSGEGLARERRRTARRARPQRLAIRASAVRNVSRTSCGNRNPKTARTAGMTLCRRMSPVSDLSKKSKSVRSSPNSPIPACSRTLGCVKYGSRISTMAIRMIRPSNTPSRPPRISSSTGYFWNSGAGRYVIWMPMLRVTAVARKTAPKATMKLYVSSIDVHSLAR